MPDLRTEITEIITGAGVFGYPTLALALESPPAGFLNVSADQWLQLRQALADGHYHKEFQVAWSNGQTFLRSTDGLRSRLPRTVEWKGSHRPPAYEQVPADLRIDHVYLVSCKYQSRILFNPSPAHLFDRCLSDRSGEAAVDWYRTVQPEAYQTFYSEVRTECNSSALPEQVEGLQATHRTHLKESLSSRAWPPALQAPYRTFCSAIAESSAQRWRASLGTIRASEHMLWRLLRLGSAPYFVLGDSPGGPLQLRVYTPWDWRQEFQLKAFHVRGDATSGQPLVRWQADVEDKVHAIQRSIHGHVEIRWSHGRFGGNPEAKVYLDTPHAQVPGYAVLS